LSGKRILISVLFVLILWESPPFIHSQDRSACPSISVYFSPKGGCTEAIVKELDKAKSSILVQAYSFTSVPIAKALLSAHKRGIKVEVILDKSQRTKKYSSADFMVNQGIPTKIDAIHAIGHNKIMVFREVISFLKDLISSWFWVSVEGWILRSVMQGSSFFVGFYFCS